MDIRDRIVVVEDDSSILNLLKTILNANNYNVLVAVSGAEALTIISSHCPDLVILDLEITDMDRTGLLKSLREWSSIPIVVLSERAHEKDIVEALDLGADDYITKPFGTSELLARIRSAIRSRRTGMDAALGMQNGVLHIGSLTIDYNKHRVLKDDRDVGLTQTEFRLVSLLGRYAGRVITYDMIIREMWGRNLQNDNRILRVNMANIRKKIENNPAEPEFIFTEAGVGYFLREPD